MRIFVGFFVCLISLASSEALLAQDVEDRPAEVTTSRKSAEEFYHLAFQKLAEGDDSGAARELEMLVRIHPSHPLALRADLILELLQAPASPKKPTKSDVVKRRGGETPSGLARGELVVTQTLHGIALGAELCVLIDCDDARLTVGTILVTAASGLAFSLLINRETGMYPGHTSALNSGTYWGAWHGLAGSMVLDANEDTTAGMMAISQLAGLGIGHLIYTQVQPSAGDVSMTTSVGAWLAALTLMGHGISGFEASSRVVFGTMLAASDAGLITGALLTKTYPMSRGRSLIIDASGIAGTLFGIGVPVLISGDDVNSKHVFAGAMAGSLLGLGLAITFTHDTWDDPEDLAVNLNLGLQPAFAQETLPFQSQTVREASGGLFVLSGSF